MPDPYNNNGSTYINPNICKSFTQTIPAAVTQLSAQVCSEATFYSHANAGTHIKLYDESTSNWFLLDGRQYVTLRGLTTTGLVSAESLTGSHVLTYRTAFFSCLPQR